MPLDTQKTYSFDMPSGDKPTFDHLSMKYAVMNATNDDILVGQQTLYLLGFGWDNWTEETWIRP